ncbi:DUF3024 domain-containing protein [Fodinicurvata sediminis]|uniref:DUF3024 domain-containing protein n=1 Tax=Fodinicurvata sediminis TaxID=1121832 RepID=UPI0003B5E8AA|nr:hypothetical protein [Fodinicurvata sediminis]
MAKTEKRWVRIRKLTREEKEDMACRCERFLEEFLRPTFIPEIRPSEWNYPVDLFGKWHGHRYSFIVRYRSGFPDTDGEEFDAPFARLDHVEEKPDRVLFDVMWKRHTGQWWPIKPELELEDALQEIRENEVLHPPM